MSLMKAENRERFKADERAYLDEWPMTEEQKAGRAGARPELVHAHRREHLLPAKIGATDARASSRWPAA